MSQRNQAVLPSYIPALQLEKCLAIIEESTEKAIFSSSTLEAKHLPTGCRGKHYSSAIRNDISSSGRQQPPQKVAIARNACYNNPTKVRFFDD